MLTTYALVAMWVSFLTGMFVADEVIKLPQEQAPVIYQIGVDRFGNEVVSCEEVSK